jgi:hypothetical protein
MAIDWTKPFKVGRVTHRGLAKPGHPIFSDGPIIAGIPLTEWLGVSPEKVPPDDKVAPKGKPSGKR